MFSEVYAGPFSFLLIWGGQHVKKGLTDPSPSKQQAKTRMKKEQWVLGNSCCVSAVFNLDHLPRYVISCGGNGSDSWRWKKVEAQRSSPCATHCWDRAVCNYTSEYRSGVFGRWQRCSRWSCADCRDLPWADYPPGAPFSKVMNILQMGREHGPLFDADDIENLG